MVSEKRINQLEQACEFWEKMKAGAEEQRDRLISWKERGVTIYKDGDDITEKRINEEDNAANNYYRQLLKVQSLKDRAIHGEDV